MVYVAMVHGVIVICHMSGFPNQSLDSIHGHGSSESIQPWNDTSSASSGRICDDHLSQYHQHVCLYIYDILYVFHVLNLIFEATFHKEIVMALWRRRYFDIFVDR